MSWAVLGLAFSAWGCSNRRSDEALATDRAAFTVGPKLSPAWRFDGDEDGDTDEVGGGFGRAVAFADPNGDGFADLVVGASTWGSNDRGAVFTIEGSASGLAPVWSWKAQGAAGEKFGRAVAGVGDVNGDGFEDVAVAGTRATGRGFVSVFYGSANGLASSPGWTRTGTQDGSPGLGAQYASGIAGAGDVNGDGYDDLVIGARYESRVPGDVTEDDRGIVYVHAGGASGPSVTPSWTLYGSTFGAFGFGINVDGAGDFNADGYDDVVVGSDESGSWVFMGSATGFSGLLPPSRRTHGDLGFGVAGVGDVNGDGYDDVGVVRQSPGAAEVFLGPPPSSGITPAIHWHIDLPSVGRRIHRGGDVNGDGFADFLVSSDGGSNDQSSEGLVHLFTGSSTGLTQQAAARMEGDLVGARLGIEVAGGGDVTGDGYDDLAAGAFGAFPVPTEATPSFAVVYEGDVALTNGGSSSGGAGGAGGTAGTSGGGSGGTSGGGSGGTGGDGDAGESSGGETADAGASGESAGGTAGTVGGSGRGGSGSSGSPSGGRGGRSSGSGGSSAGETPGSAGEATGASGEAGENGAGASAGSGRGGGAGNGGKAGAFAGGRAGAPATAAQSIDDGGCACGTVPRRGSDSRAALVGLIALGALSRRRRRVG